MKTRNVWLVTGVLMAVVLALISCAPKPAVKPAPVSPPPAPAGEGGALYNQKCAACHGLAADGTAIAPAIAGHSIMALKMQVRDPMGKMPPFTIAQLSDSDLDKIADFVADLGSARAPVQDWEKAATETIHFWMALVSIKNRDVEDARHHLQDALAFIKEPMHKAEVEAALSMISQGNFHDAEHKIEDMAGSESPSGVTMQRFHLLLAQRGIQAKKADEVKHHLEHFIVKASEPEKAVVKKILELVAMVDFHEAEHEIENLLK